MPRTKSAKKAMRQSRHRNEQNRWQRTRLRSAVKKVRQAATKAEAAEALLEATALLDRAGRKNLIHRNTASRTKGRLAKLVAAKS